jgi:serine/threonine-protein kinase RsbW
MDITPRANVLLHPGEPAAGGGQADVCVELVSKPMYLCAIRDLARQITKRLGFQEDQAAQIVLAIDEALANVMKHGYGGASDGRIWVRFIPMRDDAKGPGLRVVVEDEGVQVDPAGIKGRDLEDIRPGGLGVHIIRQVMDLASYELRAPKGMRLTLEKFISSPAVGGGGPGGLGVTSTGGATAASNQGSKSS